MATLTRLVEFFGELDPIEYFSLRAQSLDEVIQLDEIGFTFAIEYLPPEVGSIKTFQVDWDGYNGQKTDTEIEMEPCDSLGVTNLSLANEFSMARDGDRTSTKYLCPSPESKMQVVGDYSSREFRYLKVVMLRCIDEELPEGQRCMTNEYL